MVMSMHEFVTTLPHHVLRGAEKSVDGTEKSFCEGYAGEQTDTQKAVL